MTIPQEWGAKGAENECREPEQRLPYYQSNDIALTAETSQP
jgi:hypothetical protein